VAQLAGQLDACPPAAKASSAPRDRVLVLLITDLLA